MTSKIIKLAGEASKCFIRAERQDGTIYVKRTPDAPDWIQDMVFHAHGDGDILPDDWVYEFVEAAVDAVADLDDDTPDDEIYQDARERIEADIYTSELTAWLHSSAYRVDYLTEALEAGLGIEDGFKLLSYAQQLEREEVLNAVVEYIEFRK